MTEPYIRRSNGDVISAEDWNEIQVRTRADIAALEARLQGLSVAPGGAPAPVVISPGPQIFEASLKAGDEGGQNLYNSKAFSTAYGVGFAKGQWTGLRAIQSPSLIVKVAEPSLLQISAHFSVHPDYAYWTGGSRSIEPNNLSYLDVFQLAVSDGKRSAPLRGVGLTTEDRPTLSSLYSWLETHQKQYASGSGWPAVGLVSYTQTGFVTPHHLDETLSVPYGTWTFQLAAQLASTRLYNIRLRAIAFPLGDRG